MDLFKELGESLKPENSLLSKSIEGYLAEKEDELKAIAEEATEKVIDPESPHFRNYVLMYMLGYQDAKLKRNSNLLDSIKK